MSFWDNTVFVSDEFAKNQQSGTEKQRLLNTVIAILEFAGLSSWWRESFDLSDHFIQGDLAVLVDVCAVKQPWALIPCIGADEIARPGLVMPVNHRKLEFLPIFLSDNATVRQRTGINLMGESSVNRYRHTP